MADARPLGRTHKRGRLFERLNLHALAKPADLRATADAFARQLAAFSRRIAGIIEAFAMDGALMAMRWRSGRSAAPPAVSTAG